MDVDKTTNRRDQRRTLLSPGLSPRLLLLYGLTLLLALPASWALLGTLGQESAGSLAPLQLLDGFNYTVVTDFWADSGRAVWPLLRVGWLLSLVYWLVWAWATGGILYSFQASPRQFIQPEAFWQAGTRYVARNIRLSIVSALFAGLVLLVPLLIGGLLGIANDDTLTEPGWFGLVGGSLAVGLLGVLLVWCVADYARVLLFRTDDTGALRAFGRAGRLVLAHPGPTLGRYLLLVALTPGLLALYWLLDTLLPARTWPLIGLLFLVQQTVVLGRLWLKIQLLRVAYRVSERYVGLMARRDDPEDGGAAA